MGENEVYAAKEGEKVVEFDGQKYAVKGPLKQSEDGRTWLAFAVVVGEEKMNGMYFPAVEIEAFKMEDGSWDVIGIRGPELDDESGGTYGMLLWSDKDGFVER